MLPYNNSSRLLLVFVVLSFFISNNVFTQEENLKEMYMEANSNFLYEEYDEALPTFQRILRSEPENYNVVYKIGVCYLRNEYQKQKAIKYLKDASEHISDKYRENSYKEKMAPPDAMYYLAEAYRVNGYLDKAIETYNKFKKTTDPQIYDMEVVENQLNSCFIAKELKKHPIYYSSENAGETINSRFSDINPVISGDGKHMVFTVKLQFYDAVFYSKKTNDKWGSPENLTPDFGLDGSSYSTGISYNGDEIFVYRSDNYDGNIYVSKKVNDKWTKLQKLNENINTKYWESHASLSPDGNYLYFTSNRQGGYGGLDIYRAKRDKNGKWSEVVNLGPVVNSEYNEETPFLTNNGHILYFSSQGHYNMGGYDIFYSTKQSNGNWSKPVNIGYPLNTSDDDLFFSPYSDGFRALYSIYNTDGSGLSDIYMVDVYNDLNPRKFKLHGKTNADIAGDLSTANVKLYDVNTGEVISQTSLNKDGSYNLQATQGTFKIVIEGDDFSAVSDEINIPINSPSDDFNLPFLTLTKTKVDKIEKQIKQESEIMKFVDLDEKFIVVNDTSVLEIPIVFKKDANLKVIKTLNGKLIGKESITLKKKKHTYYYKPKEGVNTLSLTITDDEGNSYSDEIIISCKLASDVDESVTEMQPVDVNLDDISNLATGRLKEYLKKLDIENVDSPDALFELLQKGLENGDFSLEELIDFYSKYFAQKSAVEFYNELLMTSEGDLNSELQKNKFDSLKTIRSIAYTFAIDVEDHGRQGFFEEKDIKQAYKNIISHNKKVPDIWKLIKSSIDNNLIDIQALEKELSTAGTADSLFNRLEEEINNEEEWMNLLRFISTSIECNAYFFDLLYAADGKIKETLSDIQLERDSIYSSVNLVNHLFSKTGKNYSLEELVKFLNKVKEERLNNLKTFYEILTMKATGNLKSKLRSIEHEIGNFNSYEELVQYLLDQSLLHQYTKENVYQLLLDLINPENVENFAYLLEKYADKNIRKALASVDIYTFSNPMELLQYLLSQTEEFNYTESDIIDLLLRLILEKGLDEEYKALLALKQKESSGRLSKVAKSAIFVSVIVILIGAVIIFLRRKKK